MKTNRISCANYETAIECDSLDRSRCFSKTCKFYISHLDVMLSKHASNRRLASLLPKAQQYIADKYYSGQKPWVEGGEQE
jgi:hypothetical protein